MRQMTVASAAGPGVLAALTDEQPARAAQSRHAPAPGTVEHTDMPVPRNHRSATAADAVKLGREVSAADSPRDSAEEGNEITRQGVFQ